MTTEQTDERNKRTWGKKLQQKAEASEQKERKKEKRIDGRKKRVGPKKKMC